MLKFSLSDMKDTDGSLLRYKVDNITGEYILRISDLIRSTTAYRKLSEKVGSKRLILYFQYYIRKEIYPVVIRSLVIRWYRHNGKSINKLDNIVPVPKSGIFSELIKCWDIDDVPINPMNPVLFHLTNISSIKPLLRSHAKEAVSKITKRINTPKKYDRSPYGESDGMIACHYSEGINLKKRSDINWFPESGVKPENVLIYFDDNSLGRKKFLKKGIVEQIEKMGFRWVALKKGAIEGTDLNYWSCPELAKKHLIPENIAKSSTEKWLIRMGNRLLQEVNHWSSFYRKFNIKINYITDNEYVGYVAPAIAFDVDAARPGVVIGKQRSEMFCPGKYEVGYYPKHVYFIWGKRLIRHFSPNYDRIDTFIINGHPNDIFRWTESKADILRAKGAKFVITLFDNNTHDLGHLSAEKMAEAYLAFLQWVVQDETFGLIIKSKSPATIRRITAINGALEKAVETGRCFVMDEHGRMPSEASFGSDMCIGCGISSALTEAVIAGARGITYDMSCCRGHEFYKWGHGEIIFDNLERMMDVLRRYKDNPKSYPKLGDWAPHIDEIDPFHDGKGDRRMGLYMNWLLEGLSGGRNREDAVREANELYKKRWGEDKIAHIDIYE